MTLDEEQLFRDDLAERRRERDRHREPRRPYGAGRLGDLARRHRAEAHRLDLINAAVNATSITAIECPACLAPVFAPADSSGERVDCAGCEARLVTLHAADGVTAVLLPDGAP